MNQRRIALFGLMLGLASALPMTPSARGQAATPTPTKVAVVNLREAYGKLASTKDVQEHISKMQSDLTSMQNLHKSQLEDFAHQINNLKAGSSQREDMMAKADDMQLDYKRQEQLQQIKMVRVVNHHVVDSYKAIQAAVAEIAKKRGYDLVLQTNDTDLPDGVADSLEQREVEGVVFSRSVLYASDKINITADVVTAVDAGAGAAPAAK